MVSEHKRGTDTSKKPDSEADPGKPTIYQIKIEGHLGSQWAGWFGDVIVTLEEGGDTVLTGPVIDQSALYGLLKKVRDLGMPLLSVNRFQPGSVTVLPVPGLCWTGSREASDIQQAIETGDPSHEQQQGEQNESAEQSKPRDRINKNRKDVS